MWRMGTSTALRSQEQNIVKMFIFGALKLKIQLGRCPGRKLPLDIFSSFLYHYWDTTIWSRDSSANTGPVEAVLNPNPSHSSELVNYLGLAFPFTLYTDTVPMFPGWMRFGFGITQPLPCPNLSLPFGSFAVDCSWLSSSVDRADLWQ